MGVDAEWVRTVIKEVESASAESEIVTADEAVGAFVAREYMKEHPEDLAEIQVRAIIESTLWASKCFESEIDRSTFDALCHTFKRWIDCAVGNASVHRSGSAYRVLYDWVLDHLPPEADDSPRTEPSDEP